MAAPLPKHGAERNPRGNGPTSGPAVTERDAEVGARAVVALFRHWKISDADACRLLGGISSATYNRWKRGAMGRIGTDLTTRLSVLLGIHKALRLIFSENARAYAWVRQPNQDFAGDRALDVMLRGQLTDLLRVRHYLDAVRG
ncbi:MAG: MbcA/ParS/Xre antitoxin family protein [Pseudomonadota bacterium]